MKLFKKQVQKTSLKLIVLLFMVATISSCETNSFTGKPDNTISVKKAKELSSNFDARHRAISALIGKSDNRSSWHSLAELEQYIAYLKVEGTKKGLNVDGIRIYFGAYGENETGGRADFSTVFLVPTVKPKTNNETGVKNFAPVGGDGGDTEELDALNLGTLGDPPGKNR